jgi:DNA repair protein REV1
MHYADDLQAVSVDEALINVTSHISRLGPINSTGDETIIDPAIELANRIRTQIRIATNCEVSIGIARNIMLARLANRRAKPAGAFHIHPEYAEDFLAPLKLDDLHGFGRATSQKAQEKLGTTVLGELRKKSKSALCDSLGKGIGETVWKATRGIDDKKLESDKLRKSVSCDINVSLVLSIIASINASCYSTG